MEALEYFRIGLALLYHEARHVRRLKPQSLPDANSWGMLRALPDDRWQAWQQVRRFFVQAGNAKTVKAVEGIFQSYFRKDLAELEEVFREASWPHNIGGAKWAASAALVRGLGIAIESRDEAKIEQAVAELKKAGHNTGTLMEKYTRLESGHCR